VWPRKRVRLAGAIMHHPSRGYLPPRLLTAMGADPRVRYVRVITDPDPDTHKARRSHDGTIQTAMNVSPWRTYQACLAAMPEWCTHYLILQDDVLPCRRFLWAAVEAIRHRPTDIISFFVSDLAHASATTLVANAGLCQAWSPLHPNEPFVPTLALAYPRELAADLAAAPEGVVDRPIADDSVVGDWRKRLRLDVWLTVPSLVQHDEDAPSVLLGHRESRPRYASCFIGSWSPTLIDWTKGL
jgi:hypothetical protein